MRKKFVAAGAAAFLLAGGALTACGYDYGGNEADGRFNDGDLKVAAQDTKELNAEQKKKAEEAKKAADAKKAEEAKKAAAAKEKADIEVKGDEVKNLRTDVAKNPAAFCKSSNLPAGEGKDNKGGTCLSIPIGEIAKNPILIAVPNAPEVIAEGKAFDLKVKIEDKFGPLDLNAFTFDDSGKAGETFLEHPGELDNDGRPLLHAHLGVATLKERNGLPVSNTYDAAFSGVQGVKGDLSAKISGLKAGFYRADVYAGQPGHAPPPTATADQVQAFASFYFEVK